MRRLSLTFCAALVIGLSALATPAAASPVQIGQFFYEDFGGLDFPTFHVANDSANPFSFTLTLDLDGTLYSPSFLTRSETVAAGGSFETADFPFISCDPTDPAVCTRQDLYFADMTGITISNLLIPGLSGRFLFSANANPSIAALGTGFLDVFSVPFDQSETLTIYFEQDTPNDPGGPVPVPEPSTLLLLGSGAVAMVRRRYTSRLQEPAAN